MTPDEMRAACAPKSDQINADDLLAGPMTVTVAGVSKGTSEQRMNIRLDGETRLYRPCVTMIRVLVNLWGVDCNAWVGRRIKLFRDPDASYGGVKVGGIRISHMSGLKEPQDVTVTDKKVGGQVKKRVWRITPLCDAEPAQQTVPHPQQKKQDLSHEVLTFRDRSWARTSHGAQEWANAIGKAAADLVSAGDTAGARAVFTQYGRQLEDVLEKLPTNATAAIAAIGAVLAYGEDLGNE